MIEIDAIETKRIQIQILDIVSKFCEMSNLKYFLGYGTLIGAIRHQGFIPWDDDIDLVLMRKDYDKLIDTFNEFHDDYQIHSASNSEKFPYPFAKVEYKKSIIREDSDNISEPIGVNIDIFPLDNIPDNAEKQKMIFSKANMLRRIWETKSIVISSKRSIVKNAVLFFGKIFFFPIKPESIARKIIRIATRYKDADSVMVGNVVWGYGTREIVNKDLFSSTLKKKFEDNLYDVPVGYDEWLRSNYGDYMQLPPIEKQITHHKFRAYLK